VAVKVLPPQFAQNAERRQRFEREARTISSLSHPGICTLYDLGHEDGIHFLVMEYLDGESLAERLTRGALPMTDVLRFGADIAEALDRAHRAGIVHRDLKPGNVMITRDGVKLLDFGLAKAADSVAQPTSSILGTQAATRNPGDTPLTQEGTILGTFQYMAPEQLEGTEADSRSDIFSLGSLLYEMATGQKAFAGKSQASLIASILDRQPAPMSGIQPMTPPAFEHIVMKCLEKEPDDRWQSAQDVSGQLRWIGQESSRAGVPKAVSKRRRSKARLAWGIAALLGVATAALAALLFLNRSAPPAMVRFQFPIPEGARTAVSPRISPDGRMILFSYTLEGTPRLAVRALDALEVRDLPGTEGADKGFWSPDSRTVAFITDGKLRKISVAGGPAQTLADAPGGDDGFWLEGGEILFDKGATDPISRVASAGGISRAAMEVDSTRDLGYGWPEGLPGGRHFLCLGIGGSASAAEGFQLYACDLATGALRNLGPVGSLVRWAEPGVLLSVSEQTLVARPFDPKRLEFTGEPVPVVEGLSVNNFGMANFSVSRNGTLVYRGQANQPEQLVWRDNAGRLQSAFGDPARYGTPAVSPDGRRVAVQRGDLDAASEDIWVLDLERGTASRLTFLAGDMNAPVWSPDGHSVAYTASEGSGFILFRAAASGVGAPESLATFPAYAEVMDWSRDGRQLALHTWGGASKLDVTIVDVAGEEEPASVLRQPYWEGAPAFSPDGHWLAYFSDESGRREVYVRTYPGTEGKWQISTEGGNWPFWSMDGRTLYFTMDERKLMAASVDDEGGFRAGIPRLAFEYPATLPAGSTAKWTDGERFLAVEPVETADPEPFTVVMNWAAMRR
ncbi:protein kinase, partial [bacterium]|nr:protein kinase [bacterium]